MGVKKGKPMLIGNSILRLQNCVLKRWILNINFLNIVVLASMHKPSYFLMKEGTSNRMISFVFFWDGGGLWTEEVLGRQSYQDGGTHVT